MVKVYIRAAPVEYKVGMASLEEMKAEAVLLEEAELLEVNSRGLEL